MSLICVLIVVKCDIGPFAISFRIDFLKCRERVSAFLGGAAPKNSVEATYYDYDDRNSRLNGCYARCTLRTKIPRTRRVYPVLPRQAKLFTVVGVPALRA